jgi:predicted AAA+ superfamily ATPase
MTYLPRDISNTILAALNEMPVIALTGMRQTGKSTFLQNQPELRNRRYVTLDDFSQLAAAKADSDSFISGDEPLSIDEAQKCPELFLAIKRAVDRRRRPGQFLLRPTLDG